MLSREAGDTAFTHGIGNLAKVFINDIAGGKNTRL
jgi:hypothetical protein